MLNFNFWSFKLIERFLWQWIIVYFSVKGLHISNNFYLNVDAMPPGSSLNFVFLVL